MNLTSKRVIAGLLLAAAFTGVLLKELPWRDEAKPESNGLDASQSELVQTQVLVQGETQSDVIDTNPSAGKGDEPKQQIPFAGIPDGKGSEFDQNASPDTPSLFSSAKLPDPVATISSRIAPPDAPAAPTPFLADNHVPIAGGGNGGGGNGGGGNGGGGTGGGGGNPGGGSPGTPGQTNPPADNPNPPGVGGNDTPPNLPNNPGNPDDKVTPPKKDGDNPVDPFVPHEPSLDLPPTDGPGDQPNNPVFPEEPLFPPPGGDGPGSDIPTTPTHSVPDSGGSMGLLALALSGMAFAGRKLRQNRNAA